MSSSLLQCPLVSLSLSYPSLGYLGTHGGIIRSTAARINRYTRSSHSSPAHLRRSPQTSSRARTLLLSHDRQHRPGVVALLRLGLIILLLYRVKGSHVVKRDPALALLHPLNPVSPVWLPLGAGTVPLSLIGPVIPRHCHHRQWLVEVGAPGAVAPSCQRREASCVVRLVKEATLRIPVSYNRDWSLLAWPPRDAPTPASAIAPAPLRYEHIVHGFPAPGSRAEDEEDEDARGVTR